MPLAEAHEQMIGEKVKRGYLWTLLGSGSAQILSFLIGIVLARILSPADFGAMATCLIFTEIGSTLLSSSYVSSLLQKRTVSPIDLSTGFVLQLLTAAAVTVLVLCSAPFIGRFLSHPTIGSMLSLLSCSFIILAFSSTPSVIIRRNLDFRRYAGAGFVQIVTDGSVSVVMAFAGYGVWSLVAGKLAGHMAFTITLYYITAWVPSIRFSRAAAKSLLGMSVQFAGKDILDDLARNADYFILGRRLGMASLGFYSRARSLMTIPVTQLSNSLGSVLFPAFSIIQDDRERLIRGLIKSSCLIAMCIFPLLVGLQLVSPVLIAVVYGDKWMPMVPSLRIICLAGLFYTLDPPAVSLINAKGFVLAEIKRQCVHLFLLAMAVFWGSRWGLTGAAWGVTVAAWIYWLFMLQLLQNRIGLSWRSYLEGLIPAVVGSLTMAGVVLAYQVTLSSLMISSHMVYLVGSISLGAASYLSALVAVRLLFRRPLLTDAFMEVETLCRHAWGKTMKALFKGARWQNV
jgi:O-antigen/teichoic acid export membrane protein